MCAKLPAANVTTFLGSAILTGALMLHPTGTDIAPIVEQTPTTSDAAVRLPDMSAREYVAARATRHGWTLHEWKCATKLITLENRGWGVHAVNRQGSSAYGLFQMLHTPKGTPLHKQVDRFFRYIDSRYDGSPCKALAFHRTNGWY